MTSWNAAERPPQPMWMLLAEETYVESIGCSLFSWCYLEVNEAQTRLYKRRARIAVAYKLEQDLD
jgi:hypothetical protein